MFMYHNVGHLNHFNNHTMIVDVFAFLFIPLLCVQWVDIRGTSRKAEDVVGLAHGSSPLHLCPTTDRPMETIG